MIKNHLVILLLPHLLSTILAAEPAPQWVPLPKNVTMGMDVLAFPKTARICMTVRELEPLSKVLAEEILLTTGVRLTTASDPGAAGDVVLRLDPGLKGESYTLDVADSATVTGGTYQSVATGTVTLLQALRAAGGVLSLPQMRVADEPAYAYRGALIDLGRKYHSPASIKQVIELCRLYKIRYLQLHLTDDQLFMFPSTRFPQLGKSNKEFTRFDPPTQPKIVPYTLDELRDLEKFARDRGVFLLPELDLPGHSGRLIADAPEIFGIPGNGSTVNIASAKTLEALTVLIHEVMDVFKSTPYIHLGADEVGLGGLDQTPEYKELQAKTGIKSVHDLYCKFIVDLHAVVKARGKQAIVWEEACNPDGAFPLPKDVIVMSWTHGRNPADIVKHGYQVINASWTPLYIVRDDKRPLDFLFNWQVPMFGQGHLENDKFTTLLETDRILGTQICSWENPEKTEIPNLRDRLALVAERAWNPQAGGTLDGFKTRLAHTDAILDKVIHPVANGGKADTSGAPKPNILLILADDLGFSDLGCYGGEIKTPQLDALAENGLRLAQFYNSARCSPTRASLLTGVHPHQAGFPNLHGRLTENVATIPEVLKPAGYQSYMVGKWHLNDKTPPIARGFDEFYGMLGGYNSCWQEDPFYTRWPQGREKRAYPKDKFYATGVFADYAVDFIRDGQQAGKPWFLYLAFNAPHFPLHAPEADIAKYEAMYFAKGWDRIREERLARMKQLGIMPSDLALTPRANIPANRFNLQTGWADKDNPAWDSLPEDRRHDLARRMAVYAAMVDRMDAAIGRVVEHLKTSGQLDNTLVVFLSDNGACAEWDPWGFDKDSGPQNILHQGDDLNSVGGPQSYVSYGSGWANACNTPFRLYKHYNQEGGIRTPFIVHWPAGLKAKGLAPGPGYLTDIMPTLCAISGATYPLERDGTAILPQEGDSLLPAFHGKPLPPRQIFIEHEGNRSVRDGDWKLVALHDSPWELYDLATDPTEMHNLSAGQMQRVNEMSAAWDAWAARCKVRVKQAKPVK